MKERTGFVSNSSGSSFCIYGTAFEGDWTTILKALKKNAPDLFEQFKKATIEGDDEIKNWLENIDNVDYDPETVDEIDPSWEVGKLFKDAGLTIRAPYGWDTVYIGRSWKSIDDDETGAQFKKKIEDTLKNAFGTLVEECSTLEEAWRDG